MAKVRELCGLIHAQYDTESALAKELGWSRQRLNKITTGQKEPDLHEAAALARSLGVSLEFMAHIFLKAKSPNGQRTGERTA